ncbi:MAG: hypothetical protein ACJ8F7_02815 [Gemmataceae bacterium]
MQRQKMLFVLATVLAQAVAGRCGPLREPVQPPTPAKEITFEQLMSIPVPANERYYAIVFGSQSTPKLPRFTHTWATAVRAIWSDGRAEPSLETYTISWMPATLQIRTFSRRTELGVNLGMSDSIQIMLDKGERVSMWGPYEMRPHSYRRFLIQKAFIDSGAVGYQCVDKGGEAGRQGLGCNCIHALTDMDPDFDRSRYPLRFNGEDASLHILGQLARRGALIDARRTQDWLKPRLGLDCAAIVPHCYDGPINDLIPPCRLPYLFPAGRPVP